VRHPSKWRLCAVDAEFVRGRLPGSFVVTSHLPGAPLRRCGCRSRAVRRARRERRRDRRGLARSRPRSVGGPRGGESGGGSSRSPRWVRIFRVDHGSPTGSPQQPECAKSPKVTDGFALGEQSERDEPDVTPVPRARERKLLAHPRGYPVIPMLMLLLWRHEIGEPKRYGNEMRPSRGRVAGEASAVRSTLATAQSSRSSSYGISQGSSTCPRSLPWPSAGVPVYDRGWETSHDPAVGGNHQRDRGYHAGMAGGCSCSAHRAVGGRRREAKQRVDQGRRRPDSC